MAKLRHSYSSVTTYLSCPLLYYYRYRSGLPKHTGYRRLLGNSVHQFVAKLHDEKKGERRYYYKTKKSAKGAWNYTWARNLEENREKIIAPSKKKEGYGYGEGWNCVKNYWEANADKPDPLFVEKRYTAEIFPGINWVGVIDQARQIKLDVVQQYRPDLVEGDVLKKGYDPVVLVDLKTGYTDYDLGAYKDDPSLLEEIRFQFPLHEDLQPTSYTWLYEQIHGVRPIGFARYDLRRGKMLFTARDRRHYNDLKEAVDNVVSGNEIDSFPKKPGPFCKSCDYFSPCRGERPFVVSKPGSVPEGDEIVEEANPLEVVKGKQLRLPSFTIKRTSRMKKVEGEEDKKTEIDEAALPKTTIHIDPDGKLLTKKDKP